MRIEMRNGSFAFWVFVVIALSCAFGLGIGELIGTYNWEDYARLRAVEKGYAVWEVAGGDVGAPVVVLRWADDDVRYVVEGGSGE